jgi:hypothetical protein
MLKKGLGKMCNVEETNVEMYDMIRKSMTPQALQVKKF